MMKMGGQKLLKIDQKWPVIKWSKNDPKMVKNGYATGGSKSSKIDLGDPGTPKTEFFEILQFSTKAPPLFDPKIDPYKWCYKFLIPHKNACTFRPRGVKKCHFLGGRGADRSDRKM
jgi:hypothetical protein